VERCQRPDGLHHRVFSYVDRGHYFEQLRRIWSWFPREQVLVLKNDDLRQQPNTALGRVRDFLGVEPIDVVTRDVHARAYEEPIDAAVRERLRELVRARHPRARAGAGLGLLAVVELRGRSCR